MGEKIVWLDKQGHLSYEKEFKVTKKNYKTENGGVTRSKRAFKVCWGVNICRQTGRLKNQAGKKMKKYFIHSLIYLYFYEGAYDSM